jgi:type VI secretion system protein ImpC
MPPSPEPAPERPPVAAGGLLDQIVGAPLPAPERAPRADEGDDLHAFIQRAVAPHLVRAPSAEESAARARSDATVDARLRRLLHHPGFQALEASWRAVDFLLRRIGDAPVQLWLVDLSRAELERDLAPGRAVEESALFTLLARPQLEGGDTWTLVVADYAFGPSLDDAALLSRIANVARVAGAPWLAAADTDAWGEEDATHPAWEALRRTPDAPMLGLVLPRLLMRLPYGRDGEPCERSTFEEMEDGQVQHESLLWGNGAVAAAALLAESFDADGWAMRPGTHRVLDALPFHVRRVDGAAVATPCVELALSERQAARIAERGLMPLAWMKDSDAAQLVRFHSVASPEAALAGRWTELDS